MHRKASCSQLFIKSLSEHSFFLANYGFHLVIKWKAQLASLSYKIEKANKYLFDHNQER